MLHPIWRLNEPGEHNLGLACNEEGLVLGRTPLIERHDGRFVVRDAADIQRLLSRAYRTQVDASSLMGGLTTVAAALNANDLLLARIAAVHLRILDLPDQAARDALERRIHGKWDGPSAVIIFIKKWEPIYQGRLKRSMILRTVPRLASNPSI